MILVTYNTVDDLNHRQYMIILVVTYNKPKQNPWLLVVQIRIHLANKHGGQLLGGPWRPPRYLDSPWVYRTFAA